MAFVSMPLFAQDNAKLSHSEVVEVAGANAKTLTDRATTFMKLKKIEPRTMANTISGIGTLTVAYTSVKKGAESGFIKFGIKMMIKDGKYKIDLTDFRHEGMQGKSAGGPLDLAKPECGPAQITDASWAKIKTDAPELMKAFVQELKTKMDNPVKATPVNTDF